MSGTRPALVAAVGFVTGVLTWDAVRVWMPSILFVVGDAGSTPAPVMGAVALVTVGVPVLVVALLIRAPLRLQLIVGAAGLGIGRLTLIVAAGGLPQFVGAALSIVGGIILLATLARVTRWAWTVRSSWFAGIGLSTIAPTLLGNRDPLWLDHGLADLWSFALVLTLVSLLRSMATPHPAADSIREQPPSSFPALTPTVPWWVTGLGLGTFGILVAPAGRIAVATGWSEPVVAAVHVGLVATLVTTAVAATWINPRAASLLAAGSVIVGTVGSLRPSAPSTLVSQAVLSIGLGLVIGNAHGGPPHRKPATADRSRRPSWLQREATALSAASVLAAFTLVGFAYYAPYDLLLPFPPRAVLLVAASIIAVVAMTSARTVGSSTISTRMPKLLAVTAAASLASVLAAAITNPAIAVEPHPAVDASSDLTVTVLLYNLHMGFDIEGRASIDRIATTLADVDADIVVLNEVDRGWMTTGSRDDQRILEGALAQRALFAPAADGVWGNALITRWPVADFRFERLARGRDAMIRSMFSAVVEPTPGHEFAVVGTHLSHVDQQGDTRMPQARALAAETARLRDRGLPVIVAGDFNAEPNAPEIQSFGDLVRPTVPPGNPTWPSWSPQVQIDHVLVSPEFRVTMWSYVTETDSDHVGVVVELTLAAR